MNTTLNTSMKFSAHSSVGKSLRVFFFLAGIFFFIEAFSGPLAKLKVLMQDETVHLEFSGLKKWDYSIEKKQLKTGRLIEMLISNVDIESVAQLKKLKSPYFKSIKVLPHQEDGKTRIEFEIVKNIESFDYLVEDPSRLVVDLYLNAADENVAEENIIEKNKTAEKNKKNSAKSIELATEKNKKSINKNRKPATADFLVINNEGDKQGGTLPPQNKLAGIFDGADPFYDRFNIKDYEIKEEAIIKSKENYYIHFPDIDLSVKDWKKILDAENLFEIISTDKPDNKMARLLQTLMDNQRHQVFLKTYDWFIEKYPQSEYLDIVNNMWIAIQLKFWFDKKDSHYYDLATQKMREIVDKKPEHPLSEKYSLMLGILAYGKKDYFNSLRAFQNHGQREMWNKKGSFSADLAKLGMGLSFLKLNQFDEAYSNLTQLENDSIYKELKSEAAFRKGDVRLKEKKYSETVLEYKKAIEKFSQFENQFPNAFYNQAQALFLQEKYRESLNTYLEFIKKFPQSEQTPYAMTRVGELLEILGADQTKVIGAYLETYFRNGDNPTATVARLRLLSSKMKTMKPKEVEAVVKEIGELSKHTELEGIEQFATIMISEGYQRREEYDNSLKSLINYYKENPSTVNTNLFTKRIVSNIYSKIEKNVDEKNFISALKIYNEYFDNWLKPATRLDIKFQIGKAFELGGVLDSSEKYYKEVINKIYATVGTKEGKERSINEKLPSIELLNLRLAVIENQRKNYNKSFDYLRLIKNPDKLSETEQIERIILASELYEKRGDMDSSILYLSELLKYWKGLPELMIEPYFFLSQLETEKGQTDEALRSLKKVDEIINETQYSNPDLHLKVLSQLAKLSEDKNETDQAIGWYEKLLEKYEDKFPIASQRYRLGLLYFNQGKIQKASEVWSSFKGQQAETWKKIASDQIRTSEWKNEYKKYIDRIPAMEKKP